MELLFKLLIFFLPLDIYTHKGISIPRLIIIFIVVAYFVNFLKSKYKITKSLYYCPIFLYLISLGVSYFSSFDRSEAVAFLKNEIIFIVLLLILINQRKKIEILELLKMFVYSSIFNFLFFVNIFYSYYIKNIKFKNLIFSNIDARDYYYLIYKGGGMRNSYPYATSTALGIISGFFLIISLQLYQKDKEKKYLLFSFFNLILMFSAQSKTPIVAIILMYIFLCKISVEKIKIFFASTLILFGFSNTNIVSMMTYRFINYQSSTKGHIEFRIAGLKVWILNFKNFIFGIGLSSINEYKEYYLTVNQHTSYLTILVQKGLFGFFSYFWILFLSLIKLRKSAELEKKYLYVELIYFLICFLFYDCNRYFTVFIFLAIAIAYSEKKIKESKGD